MNCWSPHRAGGKGCRGSLHCRVEPQHHPGHSSSFPNPGNTHYTQASGAGASAHPDQLRYLTYTTQMCINFLKLSATIIIVISSSSFNKISSLNDQPPPTCPTTFVDVTRAEFAYVIITSVIYWTLILNIETLKRASVFMKGMHESQDSLGSLGTVWEVHSFWGYAKLNHKQHVLMYTILQFFPL